jgi:hypothetical protein
MRPKARSHSVHFALMLGIGLGVACRGESTAGVDLARMKGWDIVVADDASASESHAATEFQHWLEQASGSKLPLVREVTRASQHVFIGASKALRQSKLCFSTEGYGEEDLRIVVRDGNIAIAGGRPRGTLYGVYTFLEDYLGVRFLTFDHTYVPAVGASRPVGPLDRFYHPVFLYRNVYDGELELRTGPEVEAFSARLRSNARLAGLGAPYGGVTPYRLINHSFYHQIPHQRIWQGASRVFRAP